MSKKFSDLTQLTTPATNDVLPIDDVSAGTTKKIIVSDLLNTPNAIAKAGLASASVDSTKVDWTTTGGIWWQELGRTSLSTSGSTITISSITTKKYLTIRINIVNSGAVTVGIRFNNDAAANYAYRTNGNGTEASAVASANQVTFDSGSFPFFINLDVINNASQEKLLIGSDIAANTAGAGNIPGRVAFSGKWSNTSSQISRVDVVNTGAGSFAAGSEVIVLGHD